MDQFNKIIKNAPDAIISLRVKITDVIPESIDLGLSINEIEKRKQIEPEFEKKVNGLCIHMRADVRQVFKPIDKCEEIMSKHLRNIKVINIGGGWNIFGTHRTDKEFYLKLNQRIQEMQNKYGIQFYSEPGRGVVKKNGAFFTMVESYENIDGENHVYLDTGSCNSFKHTKIIFIHKQEKPRKVKTNVFHYMYCNNSEIFKMHDTVELSAGDMVCFADSGYGFSRSTFHSFKDPKLYVI